jgi:hypothetical protein
MRNGRALQRRLEKLESVLNVLSTEDKWTMIHDRALQLMSDNDLVILEEIAVLQKAGRAVEQTPERLGTIARFDGACMTAMGEGNIRFTIPEMDQLLAGA